ncbi:MAG: carbohydrate-binding domain-containing protein, partial [Actinomycetota bacterium]
MIAGVVISMAAAMLVSVAPIDNAAAAPGDPITVVVRARGTLADGVGPDMSVRVGGDAGGVSPAVVSVDSEAAADFTFTIPEPAGASSIDVVFTNDLWLDPEDRNLIIESVTIDGVAVGPADVGVTIDRGAGEAAFDGNDVIGGQNTLWWNASLRIPFDPDNTPDPPDPVDPPTGTTGTIVVDVAGTPAAGIWPDMTVLIGGQP